MWTSIMTRAAAAALTIVTVFFLTPTHSFEALAQTEPLYITTVDLDIDPQHYAEFIKAMEDDGTESIKEAGVREFDIAFSEQATNNLFLFIAYDNAAAWDVHQKTPHYGKFLATTTTMIKKYDFSVFSSAATNKNGPVLDPFSVTFVAATYLDIVPAVFDRFMDAAKENATASMKDPGCRKFHIAISQQDPHRVLLYLVFYNAAGFDQYRASDHFKKFEATTASMVAHREQKVFKSLAMFSKSR